LTTTVAGIVLNEASNEVDFLGRDVDTVEYFLPSHEEKILQFELEGKL
jgi:hypothetical protein